MTLTLLLSEMREAAGNSQPLAGEARTVTVIINMF
jgi:hypothetical protein